jgi:hypothetical protein
MSSKPLQNHKECETEARGGEKVDRHATLDLVFIDECGTSHLPCVRLVACRTRADHSARKQKPSQSHMVALGFPSFMMGYPELRGKRSLSPPCFG